MTHTSNLPVAIIGGSFAGLSAAMALGRALRPVLVIDSGAPCNRFAPQAHNLIGHDGTPPGEIAWQAEAQVLAYSTVKKHSGRVVRLAGSDGAFEVEMESGELVRAAKIILATGVRDILPAIPGFAACWGKTAIHCPYCHGFEVRGRSTGILVNDDSALEFAQLILNWTDKAIVFSNGPARFEVEKLARMGVEVVEGNIAEIEQEGGEIKGLFLENGPRHALGALYHRPEYEQTLALPEGWNCAMTESGHVQVDMMQQTNVPGLYAAGDCTTPFRSLSIAMAQGSTAGAMVNHHLIAERFAD